jgi:hypothetical protein
VRKLLLGRQLHQGAEPQGEGGQPGGRHPRQPGVHRLRATRRRLQRKVPEGWARRTAGGAVSFTDKLNTIRIESHAASAPLTATAARGSELGRLSRSVKGFKPGKVSTVTRKAGTAVRITYLASSPADPVTGKTVTDAVERYVFFHKGRAVVLTLSGPKGADNVDPWRLVTDSVRWSA